MAKISISEISKILVEKHGFIGDKAEAFVAEMFALIQDALQKEPSVKIKGFGTFKIIGVEARESINVNTGERVVIEGHGKITFTPDTSMKDLVNKPFSQFETVILNDGVEFNDIETSDEEQAQETADNSEEVTSILYENNAPIVGFVDEDTDSPITDALESPETKEGPENETQITDSIEETEEIKEPEVVNELEVINEPEEVQEIIEEEVIPEAAQSDSVLVETELSVEDQPQSEPEQEQKTTSYVSFAESFADLNNDDKPTSTDSENDTDNVSSDDEDDEEEGGKRKWGWLLYILLTLVLMAVSAYCGYQYGIGKQNNVAVADSLSSSYDDKAVVADTLLKVKSDSLEVKKDTATVNVTSVNKEETFDSSIYEEMDERVRTGAYRIVGTDTVITVRNGETMRRLCKRTLGVGMACYIEVYNGIAPNSPLTPGQKIKIPKLQWKVKKKK